MVSGSVTASLTMCLVVVGLDTLVVEVRDAAGAERVGVAVLQVCDVLPVELIGVVIQAELLWVAEVRSPVRPVVDTIQVFEKAPGQLRVLLLEVGPSPLILESLLRPSRSVEAVAVPGGGGEVLPGPVRGVGQGVERLHEHSVAAPQVVVGICMVGSGHVTAFITMLVAFGVRAAVGEKVGADGADSVRS